MDADAIKWINNVDEIKKLTLKAGDCLVVTSRNRLSYKEYEGLKNAFGYLINALGLNENEIKVVILENDIRLGVLSKEDQE